MKTLDQNELMARVTSGDPDQREAVIAELAQRATQSGDRDDWNGLAMALFQADRFDEAAPIWERLVEAYPDQDVFRLNLATAFSQTRQVSLCQHHLAYLAQHAGSVEMRATGREQLDAYEQFVGLTEDDTRLRALQFAALQEAIEGEVCPAGEYRVFATLLRRAHMLEPASGWLDRSRLVLEAGVARHPDDVPLLELLVATYLSVDPNGKLAVTSRRLERLAPNSFIFEHMSAVGREDTERWQDDMSARVNDLLQKVAEQPELREAALADLQRIAEEFPQNPNYRGIYAFALMIKGDCEEAARQAGMLDNIEVKSHSFHFNLGQIFYGCGNRARGRAHLDLAITYAQDDSERQDAWERIAELEKH